MLSKYKPFIAAFFVLLICSLAYSANHYSQLYRKVSEDLKTANDTIGDMKAKQDKAAELDAKYTKDLADAQNVIDNLRSDVDAGNKRLSVKAICVRKESSTSSMGDAGAAELSSDARQDYYRLREQLAMSDKQIRYLQDYIKSML